jgi:hypothetical protein
MAGAAAAALSAGVSAAAAAPMPAINVVIVAAMDHARVDTVFLSRLVGRGYRALAGWRARGSSPSPAVPGCG